MMITDSVLRIVRHSYNSVLITLAELPVETLLFFNHEAGKEAIYPPCMHPPANGITVSLSENICDFYILFLGLANLRTVFDMHGLCFQSMILRVCGAPTVPSPDDGFNTTILRR